MPRPPTDARESRGTSAAWYARRLLTMSPGEIGWRAVGVIREIALAMRIVAGRFPRTPHGVQSDYHRWTDAVPRLCDVRPGEWRDTARADERQWRDRLIARADRIARHRVSFFDLDDCHLGDPVQWNRDH